MLLDDETYFHNPEEHRQVILEGIKGTTKDVGGIVNTAQNWRGSEELKTRVLLGVGQLQLGLLLADYLKYDLPEEISSKAGVLVDTYGGEARGFIEDSLRKFNEQRTKNSSV